MPRENTLMNGLVGGVVTVLLSFIPFSPLLGGGVAGYLQKGTTSDGAKAGAVAGAIASVPVLLLVFVALFFAPLFAVVGQSGVPLAVGFAVVGLLVTVVLFVALYTVGLSVVGGAIGAYVADEMDGDAGASADASSGTEADEDVVDVGDDEDDARPL